MRFSPETQLALSGRHSSLRELPRELEPRSTRSVALPAALGLPEGGVETSAEVLGIAATPKKSIEEVPPGHTPTNLGGTLNC